ncbi:MAG: hypothetical protein WCQ77_10450, partial [Planctomycetota bacterium]
GVTRFRRNTSYAIHAIEERVMMNAFAFALLVGIVLAGISVKAAVSLGKTGRLELSRFWYLALGLVLMLPTMGQPFALLREIQNPNPRIHAFNLPLTLAWGLGLYLVVRFGISRPSKAQVVNAA